MITKQLKEGDHIFSPVWGGIIAVVIRVNKRTYTTNRGTIPMGGLEEGREWFECDDAQAKALEIALDNISKREADCRKREAKIKKARKLVRDAKDCLASIPDVDVVLPDDPEYYDEEDEDGFDDDGWDDWDS